MEELFDLIQQANEFYKPFVFVEVYPDRTACLTTREGKEILNFDSIEDLRNHLNG